MGGVHRCRSGSPSRSGATVPVLRCSTPTVSGSVVVVGECAWHLVRFAPVGPLPTGPQRCHGDGGFVVSVREVSVSGSGIPGSSAGDLPPSVSTPCSSPAPTDTRRWGPFSGPGGGAEGARSLGGKRDGFALSPAEGIDSVTGTSASPHWGASIPPRDRSYRALKPGRSQLADVQEESP